MPWAELEEALQNPELLRAYVITGDAGPLVERARQSVEAALRPKLGPVAFNHDRFRASEPHAMRAFTSARTLPMMADLRLVEIRDLQDASSELFEAYVAYMADPSPSAVMLLSGTGFPKVEKGSPNWAVKVKHVSKGAGLVLSFASTAVAPAAFAVEMAQRLGKVLTTEDASRLVAVVGADLGRIEQEIKKLAIFVGDAPTIDSDAITLAGSMVAEAVIWDLTAGLAARDAELALTALHRLQQGGDDARKLLGMIAWQIRELLRVSQLVRAGASDKDITTQAKIRWDLLRRVRPTMERGFPDAADLLRRLATANRYMNSHRAGADRILEGFVLEMLDGKIRRPPPLPG
jgi:DNA polymerase III delta subunit